MKVDTQKEEINLPPIAGLSLMASILLMLGVAFTFIAKEFVVGPIVVGIGISAYMGTVYLAYRTLSKVGEDRFINLYKKGVDKSEVELKEFQTLRKCYDLVSPITSRIPEESSADRFGAIQALEKEIKAKQSKMSASA